MRLILRFFGILFSAAAVLFVVGAAVGGYFYWKYSQDLPDHAALSNYEPPVMTRVHAADGSMLAEYARERRLYLPIQAMPKIVVAAFLSAEDKNFYKHGGIDPEGIVRAFLTNAKSGKRQGASTITQQVAKNFLLSSEQTYDRKIKEALLALRIEAAYSKDKILELYLNEIFLGTIVPGRNLHGVAAAALDYFGKSVHELTINEAAYLAALPKGPNNYHPYRKTQAALDRRNEIIRLMAENGYITKEEAESAKKMPLGVNPRVAFPNAANANYFTEEVRREISERYGEKKLYEGGLSVRATLDPKMQAWARKALVDGLVRYDQAHGWRGPVTKVDLTGRDWGMAAAEVPALGDVAPWRLAVVLGNGAGGVQVGLQPRREASGQVGKDRETGVITPDGMRWAGRPNLQAGDMVYVEATEGGKGQFRLRQKPEVSGAIVAMDPNTGRVHAMVGGFSYDESEFNRATQAMRQPGSSFKPIVYSAALDNGYTPASIVQDSPITIEAGPGQEAWTPSNYDGKSGGPHTLRYGIEHSKNLMTVRLAKDVGMPLIAEYARRFGVYDDMLPVLPMSLGAGETTVMRMVTAYSMLANGGRRIRPTLIDRIQDRTGETIYRHDNRKCIGCDAEKWSGQDEPKLVDDSEQVLDPLTAYQMVSIMEGVVQRGTATILKQIGKPLAGKTGTTNDAKDAWFVGFSPDLAVGIYLGFDKPRSLGDRATGGGLAAPIALEFLKTALKDKPPTPFRVPPGIKLIRVNLASGTRAGSGEGAGTILEAFKPGTAPPDSYVAPPANREGPPPATAAVPPDADRAAQAGGLY
ncbi:penicillin-binding protein 1A [Methylobacterium mesophilicum SR1.6/6]|uniref:Penicillin-binding protein 1A n=1 Tax=Methylobacterium mesophilicum SR1.6/6 TaxID=908290 RepID=A0A6B9FJL8_9HYPH|nr:penicillin-binding protein 1A [Methylobacterium mesophilicum]QGY01314.1 penicillin-binding protein 1A [Methylobacterium mesophilicum SR1.6/6]